MMNDIGEINRKFRYILTIVLDLTKYFALGFISMVLVVFSLGVIIFGISNFIPANQYLVVVFPIALAILVSYFYFRGFERIKKFNDIILFSVAAIKSMQMAGESINYKLGFENLFFTSLGLGILMLLSTSAVLKAIISAFDAFDKNDKIVIWLKNFKESNSKISKK